MAELEGVHGICVVVVSCAPHCCCLCVCLQHVVPITTMALEDWDQVLSNFSAILTKARPGHLKSCGPVGIRI